MTKKNEPTAEQMNAWLTEEQREKSLKIEKEIPEYWRNYMKGILLPYKIDSVLKYFTSNSAVTGDFGEALIRSFIRSMLPHLRISTGSVVKVSNRTHSEKYSTLPQGDLIIWDPSLLPAVIDVEDFALVSNLAVRGVIEVKRGNADIPDTRQQVKKWMDYLSDVPTDLTAKQYMNCNVLGVVITHNSPLHKKVPLPNMWDERQQDPIVIRLFDNKDYSEDVDGFLTLIYFLSHIAKQPQKVCFDEIKELKFQIADVENMILASDKTYYKVKKLESQVKELESQIKHIKGVLPL